MTSARLSHHVRSSARLPPAPYVLCVRVRAPLPDTQYTSYSNGGYSYNNAPSSSNNNSGSHYYSPSGNSSGFYTQNGGKSGGGYSFYQNSCANHLRTHTS